MSKRILIGNDINVSWRVNLYDPSEERLVPLSSVSGVGVQLIVGTHSIDLTPENSSLNIVDNLITFTFYGRDQVYPGAYILKLYDKTSATITYYACNAFVIVNRDGEDIGTDPEIVDIESTVNLNRTLVTKGEKGDKGDPGVDGAAGSIGSILTIGENGNWWIDGVDTGIPATGAQGESGKFKSIVFKRSNTRPTTPTGGTYSDPIPHDPDTNERWSDGIPGGEGLIWASSATFLGNDHHTAWSIPQIMKDTTDIDIEFALMQNDDEKPAIPNDNNRHKEAFPYGYEGQIWFDPEFDEYKASGILLLPDRQIVMVLGQSLLLVLGLEMTRPEVLYIGVMVSRAGLIQSGLPLVFSHKMGKLLKMHPGPNQVLCLTVKPLMSNLHTHRKTMQNLNIRVQIIDTKRLLHMVIPVKYGLILHLISMRLLVFLVISLLCGGELKGKL